MATDAPNIAILFADICGSTRLYELLGDLGARSTVAECLATMARVVQWHGGVVIKTLGDELMCTFLAAQDAVAAACEINEMLKDQAIEAPDGQPFDLSVRVGIHYGAAIEENGDVFGDAVNLAARLVAMAKAGQIITTEPTVDSLPGALRAATRFIDRAAIRGKKDSIDIFEVIWQEDEATGMANGIITGIVSRPPSSPTLSLRYRGRELVLDDTHSSAMVGRSASCDVTIADILASRQHLKIECRRGRFFIIDQSTNGTYFCVDRGEERFLRREEMLLSGKGQLSLGRSFADQGKKPVNFEIDP